MRFHTFDCWKLEGKEWFVFLFYLYIDMQNLFVLHRLHDWFCYRLLFQESVVVKSRVIDFG